jgi:hypothetical protein
MGYWIKRIALKSGEVVTERELREDQNRFEGSPPVVGDVLEVECRGRKLLAEVVWGNWLGREYAADAVVPLRVSEVGLDPATPLRFHQPDGSWRVVDQRLAGTSRDRTEEQ